MGLLHILPRLGKSGGHIPHSSPFSYSRRLSPFPPLSPSSSRRSRGLLLPALGRGKAWDPRRGTFGGADGAGGQCRRGEPRPRSCGGRRCFVRSGIQDTAAQPGADSGTSVCVCVLPFCFCVRWEAADCAWRRGIFHGALLHGRMLQIRFLKPAGLKITIRRQQNVPENRLQREPGSGACASVCRGQSLARCWVYSCSFRSFI